VSADHAGLDAPWCTRCRDGIDGLSGPTSGAASFLPKYHQGQVTVARCVHGCLTRSASQSQGQFGDGWLIDGKEQLRGGKRAIVLRAGLETALPG